MPTEMNVNPLQNIAPVRNDAGANPGAGGMAEAAEAPESFERVLARQKGQDAPARETPPAPREATPAKDPAASGEADKTAPENNPTPAPDAVAAALNVPTTVLVQPVTVAAPTPAEVAVDTAPIAPATTALPAVSAAKDASAAANLAGPGEAAPATPSSTPSLSTGVDAESQENAAQGDEAKPQPFSLPAETRNTSRAEARLMAQNTAAQPAAPQTPREAPQASPNIVAPQVSNEAPLREAVPVVAQAAAPAAVETGNTTASLQAAYANSQPAQAARPELVARHVIQTPLAQAGWANEIGQHVALMAGKDGGMAELILTPPQLGRVEVSIRMEGDQASAQFVAASPAAREALQDAMPRLRELLAEAGIQLGQANVSAEHSQQAKDGQGNLAGNRSQGGGEGDGVGNSAVAPTRVQIGLIDTFA